jgi:putative aldouronate transport system substrate-binding protein
MLKVRRWVVPVVALVMFLVSLTGCKNIKADTGMQVDTKAVVAGIEEEGSQPLLQTNHEPYSFTYYYNYENWDISTEWGNDKVSAEIKRMFNIDITFTKPEGNPDANLNTMVAAGNLPDAIMMDRNESYTKLIEMGKFIPLNPLVDKYPAFMKNLDETTVKLLQVDGVLWGVPNWPRKPTSMTGGNWNWLYSKKLHTAAGSPDLHTLEDIYNYLTTIKHMNIVEQGKPVIPMQFGSRDDLFGGPYRSFGGFSFAKHYTVLNKKVQLLYKDPKAQAAVLFANKLWREGLINQDIYAEKEGQVAEKLAEGRIGIYYGNFTGIMDTNKGARYLLREMDPENDYIPIGYPPAAGVTKDQIYGDGAASIGWNVVCLTTNAKKPERIFEMLTFMLTPEGSRLQLYGPKGILWDETDEKGYPLLKKSETELTEEEKRGLGLWAWCIPGQADNVDNMKYAVNDRMPPEKKNWVSTIQQKFLIPYIWCSDEFTAVELAVTVDSQEGNGRDRIDEYITKNLPQAVMAESPKECMQMIQNILDFADKNRVEEIENAYTEAWKKNIKLIGKSYLKK